MQYDLLKTPIGQLLLAADADGLHHIRFDRADRDAVIEPHWQRGGEWLEPVLAQLRAYFDGELQHFNLPLAASGTPFRTSVWHALTQIPYGETISYGELARRIGNPAASRAVGAANGANPLPIVVPCHRVIGASGTLTGFGGGLPVKQWLLEHERKQRSLWA
ncbi:MAG: methylated-DNA--[protein]-cysteine S-methyltransferase [Dokdonella sp.]|uniref:methylated-DNA--[protein]-cysteine S-methyltransferase n=1 Tax=Dokdonella sp. TaxID=2291710 RepID=UPI0025C0D220|nr:methylated-DNA--[protein]-cysteine S-methyltransferase [Dokdonella sp.]MBZ0222365.1 methylated-DNA--[protein]-cysteine S-methyltransferase [Dokdonella sp.]MCC7255008.1 methylated-DNA--[protein]-cysteine S-methyltransferase [Dokdonella sp.]